MIHRIDLAKEDIYPAARRLLAAGADPADTVEGWRGNTLCLTGIAGMLAEWTVKENRHGRPSLQLVRYKAFPDTAGAPRTAKTQFQVYSSIQARKGL